MRADFVKQSNASWLFVIPRTAYFSNNRIEAAPLNPAKVLSHETESKKRTRKVRSQRHKTQSLRLESQNLKA
jgi:hypothetical protein